VSIPSRPLADFDAAELATEDLPFKNQLHELQRRHHPVCGVVAPGCLAFQHHLARGVGLYALVGQSRARDAAAPLLQRLAILSAAAHCGVQAEAPHVGAQVLLEARIPGHGALHYQHPLPGTAPFSLRVSTAKELLRLDKIAG